MKNKKRIIYILLLLIIFFGVILGLLFSGIINISNDEPIIEEPIKEEIEVIKQPYRDVWLENKNINEDYQGEIIFESGLINKSFVQAKSCFDRDGKLYTFYSESGRLITDPTGLTGNDVYIWTNWKDRTYDYDILGGSVFMDYRNELSDQNLIIYGHHFSKQNGHDPERVKAFTPLELLLDSSNYKKNKYVNLVLDNKTNKYELVSVYIFDNEKNYYLENCQYWRTEYNYDDYSDTIDDTYYESYIKAISENALYDTGVKLTPEDKTLTLQTCISGSNTLFEICVFKLIDVIEY